MPGTRKLGRPTAHRNAMLRGLVTYLLENGSIETTVTRAKEVRSMTEKMITLGKKNTLASRRAALSYITKEDVVKKLFDQIAPEYADRNGFRTVGIQFCNDSLDIQYDLGNVLFNARNRRYLMKYAVDFYACNSNARKGTEQYTSE